MSSLTIYSEDAPDQGRTLRDAGEIGRELAAIGVRFERWRAQAPLAPGAAPEDVLAAYREQIDRLVAERGYRSVDVVSLDPSHPERAALRAKFLAEHTHADDEVRFFVAGSGLFVLHAEGRVYAALCEQDDLISVPAGIRHWFDMGSSPAFTCIRLFNDPAGWVARFTGDDIATRFPTLA
ncbi:acireductone dioxygenase [Achromobacter sp. 413638]|uniref:1,2-dihydroxy-3-keto-5-methylthiopentene dioxygenase n=1 Tax=Achromobacter sp. 413638 TaxID=3342385 RepID=UPI0032501C50